MARWQRGEVEVEQLVRRRELEHMTGAAADGTPLLAQARSPLWQVINALLVLAGAWAGFGWEWWQAALLIIAVLAAPAIAAEVIRRAG